MIPKCTGPVSNSTGRKVFQGGNGGRMKGNSRISATANLSPPTSRGGRAWVASLPAALFRPQTTTTVQIAAHSARENGESDLAAMVCR